tara:strand:- start:5698 stop:6222 length:525 start_codon:yes stop_codon:yes gene_type:complete
MPQQRSANFLPLPAKAVIPRETRKLASRGPALRCGSKLCGVGRLRPLDRHRGRNGAGSKTNERRFLMATIGTFKKTGSNEFTGDIITLSVQAKGVRIIPDLRATGENAPSHRVVVGRAEIGAAWSKRSGEGRDYLGLKLDDPSFNAPIYANLFDDEDSEGYSLIWSRPNGRRGD